MTKQAMSFSYDPLELTRLALGIRLEKTEDGRSPLERTVWQRVQQSLTDDELSGALRAYLKTSGQASITLGTDEELDGILAELRKTPRYRGEQTHAEKHGFAGTGVFDNILDTFTPCAYGGHFETMCALIEAHHPRYAGAVRLFRENSHLVVADGVPAGELDRFLTETFRLVGSSRPTYTTTRKET